MTEANVALATAAAARTTVGPFLRFQSGTDPGNTEWKGSVLFLTKAPGGAAQQEGAAVPQAPPAGGEQAAPTLTLKDGDGEQRLTPKLLDSCQGWQFWRFELSLQLGKAQRSVEYSVATPGGCCTGASRFRGGWMVGGPMGHFWVYWLMVW